MGPQAVAQHRAASRFCVALAAAVVVLGGVIGCVRPAPDSPSSVATSAEPISATITVPVLTPTPRSVPPFLGTAARHPPADCAGILPPGRQIHRRTTGAPVPAATYDLSLGDCWLGTLAGAPFRLGLFYHPEQEGGIALEYDDQFVMERGAGLAPPILDLLTGEFVCYRSGYYHDTANLRTGERLSDADAVHTCPDGSQPPRTVLGLPGQNEPAFGARPPHAP